MPARFTPPGRTAAIKTLAVAVSSRAVSSPGLLSLRNRTGSNALQTAPTELGMAERDKGGHLPIAIERVDQAINQVKKGMAGAGG